MWVEDFPGVRVSVWELCCGLRWLLGFVEEMGREDRGWVRGYGGSELRGLRLLSGGELLSRVYHLIVRVFALFLGAVRCA
jgi:hypothetical protein